jgi:GTP-binding protein
VRSARIKDARFVAAAARFEQLLPPAFAEVAFAGRSNVGKSSLLNRLLKRSRLARTSSTPGCTRQLVCFEIETTADQRLVLVDLPGYGYAKRSKAERLEWAELVETYLLERPTLRVLVLLVDVRRGLESEERELLELMRKRKPSVETVVVGTKLDKLAAAHRKPALERFARGTDARVVGASAVTGAGITELWRAVSGGLGLSPPLGDD